MALQRRFLTLLSKVLHSDIEQFFYVVAVNYGGMLMVTCTDMGVLAGNHPEACFAKYGSFPLKSHFCHEQAIRIVLYSIERAANRYGRYIEPLISLHLDFFIRVFVRVHHGKKHVKLSCTKGIRFQCDCLN